jgi:hypothetical protein
MATSDKNSRESYAINFKSLSSLEKKVYVTIANNDVECIREGIVNVGVTTHEVHGSLYKIGLVKLKTSIYPRMNAVRRAGLIVKSGVNHEGKSPVDCWRTSTREDREVMHQYRVLGVETISTSLEMMVIINWFYDRKAGRLILGMLPAWIRETFECMRAEASKEYAKNLTTAQMSSYNGDVAKFQADNCVAYVAERLETKAKTKDKNPLPPEICKILISDRAKLIKGAKRYAERKKSDYENISSSHKHASVVRSSTRSRV